MPANDNPFFSQESITDEKSKSEHTELVLGEDYTINEKGYWVFTEAYHLKRGYCCNSGCVHCPYGYHERKNWL